MSRATCALLALVGFMVGFTAGAFTVPVVHGDAAFAGSVDFMKTAKDQAASGFTAADAQSVDLAATMHLSHMSIDTPIDYPAVLAAWAGRVHQDGKHVWFRLNVRNGNIAHGDLGDGSPAYKPGYLTDLHMLMLANPGIFKSGDILDGDSEAENSVWWVNHYGCGVQSSCTPCNGTGSNTPCAPVLQMNRFLRHMTSQESADLTTLGITGVDTKVHSTDPGTATHQLSAKTVKAMGNRIVVDAYSDQNTTDPATAAANWCSDLNSWHQTWLSRGIDVTIWLGEWGYSNAINVSDSQQQAVLHAETTSCFPTVPFLGSISYWVAPGWVGAGGYTYIFRQVNGVWQFRPGANEISAFYASRGL